MSGRAARGRGWGGYRGRGGARGRGSEYHNQRPQQAWTDAPGTHWHPALTECIRALDGQSYGAYKRLTGTYQHYDPSFVLVVDHVQGDAYAPPSRVRTVVPLATAGFPKEYTSSQVRRIALADYVTRVAAEIISKNQYDQSHASAGGWQGPKGGAFTINGPAQEVLARSSCIVKPTESTIELRFTASLPAQGRTILGREAYAILAVRTVEIVKRALLYASHEPQVLRQHVLCVEDQQHLRNQLSQRGLVSFVANGSLLPRASGASSRPMTGSEVVAFQSPSEYEVELSRPNSGSVKGMGIPTGVTVLTGGGFHGKSTLLEAIQLGIYDHIPGDGREGVVTDPSAVKIRAEDGRSVAGVDISPFISDLPGGRDTKRFNTQDASGSTSMASSIAEALELSSKTLLIDEDTSATNLLVRDRRMHALIEKEPITPLVSKVRGLHAQHGVSTVIVIGGLGDWLSVADHVVGMDTYVPRSLTAKARQVIERFPAEVKQEGEFGGWRGRRVQVQVTGRAQARGKTFISLERGAPDPAAAAETGVDLAGLEQLVETGQTRYIAECLRHFAAGNDRSLGSLAKQLEGAEFDDLASGERVSGDLVRPRWLEIGAAVSRVRGLQVLG